MPTRSAAKAHRQSARRNLRNRAARSAVKTALKRAKAAILSDADNDEATRTTRLAVSALDRAARKGIVHANNARRRKSRLARKLNLAIAQSPQPTTKGKTAKRTKAAARSKKSEE